MRRFLCSPPVSSDLRPQGSRRIDSAKTNGAGASLAPHGLISARFISLRGSHSATSMRAAALALTELANERDTEATAGNPSQRVFGRLMELGTDDTPTVAMHALLAVSQRTLRWPPHGIPVDQIAALQDCSEPCDLTLLLRTASQRLDQAAAERAAGGAGPFLRRAAE